MIAPDINYSLPFLPVYKPTAKFQVRFTVNFKLLVSIHPFELRKKRVKKAIHTAIAKTHFWRYRETQQQKEKTKKKTSCPLV